MRSGVQWQRPLSCPSQPQGQGFIAAMNWNSAGNVHCRAAREMWITPDSSGSRSTSSTRRSHSGNSSRNSTPRWASEISPGRGLLPPPTNATPLAVWCGARYGSMPHVAGENLPASDAITAVARASSSDNGGRMPGRRCASIDLPLPGGPIMSRLWAPAAAMVSARFACF